MQTITRILPDLFKHIDREYNSVKSLESESIINKFLSKAMPEENPSFTHVAGIPGAGKSTYINKHLANKFIIRFDHVMQNLAEYNTLLANGKSEEAFLTSEMKARIIGYELFSRAIDIKTSIILEHSLNPCHLPLYQNLKPLGYKTSLIFIKCDLNTAHQRAIAREQTTGRHTPPKLIEERFKLAQDLLPHFSKVADNFTLKNGK